ncbi:MAG TPA: carbohydrate ABC transporter permease [Caldithrix abyssi]|uniref:Carbohydrate ABC transporter permease n=1 Tax=Caldithrix abyssi TaxID=187145 RepID=A0A7V4U5X3_CALAY|nr:carbohydrate ABC transporter permease [Caldithrix abyssi]
MKTAKKTALYLFLVVTSLITVMPFVWMLSASFMPTGDSSVFPPRLFPDTVTFAQYKALFFRLDMVTYFFNSLFLSVTITLVSLFLNSMAGYAFAKFRFHRRDKLFTFLLASMIIPAQVTMLPLFLMLKYMGVLNTYLAVIIPGLANIFGIFLIRQYVQSIPDSLVEAARIDGAGEFRIYLTIILPLAKPVLITLAIFTFLGTWNDFLWPLIALTDNTLYTLPVALANLMGEHSKDPELMMAGSVLTVLPVIVVFLALQKYYIRGIMSGGIKG